MAETAAVTVPRKRGRPRKDLSIIDGGFSGAPKRPAPPDHLSDRQKQIWHEIVSTEPIGLFTSNAARLLLGDMVAHRETIEGLTAEIDRFQPEWLRKTDGCMRYKLLLNMRGAETRHFSLIATRLRLTNQSRYTPQAAATASRNTAKVRPWEEN